MPVKGTAAHTSAGPRPPLADRVTPAQWLALDAVAAVLVALWVVFDLRLRHGFRFELPQAWFGVLGAAVTLPVAVRRLWPIPVLAVVTTAVATLTALGRAELDMDIMLAMAIYTVAVSCRRPVAVAALVGTETVLIGGLIAASATAHGPVDTAHSLLTAGALWFVGDSVRERRRYLAACREQEAQRQTDHGRLAVREERVRIARELHDVVARARRAGHGPGAGGPGRGADHGGQRPRNRRPGGPARGRPARPGRHERARRGVRRQPGRGTRRGRRIPGDGLPAAPRPSTGRPSTGRPSTRHSRRMRPVRVVLACPRDARSPASGSGGGPGSWR